MNCPNCGKIVSDNTLTCPYCRAQIKEDYFGYMQESQKMNSDQHRVHKNNGSKVVFIVLGCVFGSMIIFSVLFFALFSGGGRSSTPAYNGTFSVAPDFAFSVSESGYDGDFTIYIIPTSGSAGNQSDRYLDTCFSEDSISYSLPAGEYEMVVMKNFSDMIRLKMVVSQDCQYNTVTLKYGEMQLEATNGIGAGHP